MTTEPSTEELVTELGIEAGRWIPNTGDTAAGHAARRLTLLSRQVEELRKALVEVKQKAQACLFGDECDVPLRVIAGIAILALASTKPETEKQ